jgi:glycosyltransferase involved in cell wall biosynthesis
MQSRNGNVRVLYSFPHKLGADRICSIAWYQVHGLAAAGANMTVYTGAISKPLPDRIKISTTLARGRFRIPYRLLGRLRACALHDYIVSEKLAQLVGQIDLIHTWPLGALRTLRTAAKLGIPTVLERCNAHTRFAYEIVQKECDSLGVPLPSHHEHFYNRDILEREEQEYRLADKLVCPSDFVIQTFRDQGFSQHQLIRHIYGFDENMYYPLQEPHGPGNGLRMLFVGVCAVRKGLHYALEAWLRSTAHERGTFQIAGEFLPAYAKRLSPLLAHPSVQVLGHRNDIPELMRKSDVLVLPSIEEGFGLVVAEAMGSGCVPLISNACTDICRNMENGLVHHVGDVQELTEQITRVDSDRALLGKLRAACLKEAPQFTWTTAGEKLLEVYHEVLATRQMKAA